MDESIFGKKECPFRVPENYFEGFEDRFFERMKSEMEKKDKRRYKIVMAVVKPWLAMAASFLIIALVYYNIPRLFKGDFNANVVRELDEEFINSLALIIDENEINDLVIEEDTILIYPTDSLFLGSISEEDLFAVTYFE